MTTKLSLITMPEVVINEILEYLDFLDLQKLRQVCKYFINFIDNVKSKSPLKDISISIFNEKITMDYFSIHALPMKVSYEKSGNHDQDCLITSKIEYDEERQKILTNSNFFEIFQRDLEIVLMQQKSLFRVLRFIRGKNSLNFEKILEIFPSHLLKVEEFHFYFKENEEEISQFLNVLDPKTIISISIYPCEGCSKVLRIEEILELKHWKNSEQLITSDITLQVELKNLAHFSLVESNINTVTARGIVDLKQKLLNSSLFAIIALKYVNFEDQEKFLESMGPPFENFWFFNMQHPDSEDVLRIYHDSQKSELEFKRIRRSDIPDHARIQK